VQVELRKNGTLQILLKGDDAIDVAILDAMVTKASNGQAINLTKHQDGWAVLSMETK